MFFVFITLFYYQSPYQILLFGTAVYNGSVWTFSDMHYTQLSDDEHSEQRHRGNSVIKTEARMASPSITRSPLIYNQNKMAAQEGTTAAGAAAASAASSGSRDKPKGYGSNSTNGRYNEV